MKNKKKYFKSILGAFPFLLVWLGNIVDWSMRYEYILEKLKPIDAPNKTMNELLTTIKIYTTDPPFYAQVIAISIGLIYWAYIFEKWPFSKVPETNPVDVGKIRIKGAYTESVQEPARGLIGRSKLSQVIENKKELEPDQSFINLLVMTINNKPILHDFLKEKFLNLGHNETDFNVSLNYLFEKNMINLEDKITINGDEVKCYKATLKGSKYLQVNKNTEKYKNSKAHDIKMKLWINTGGIGQWGRNGRVVYHDMVFWANPGEIPERWKEVVKRTSLEKIKNYEKETNT